MNRASTKLEKIVSYCVLAILLGLGGLVSLGVFSVRPNFRLVIVLVIVGYVVVRLVVMNKAKKN